MIAACVTGNLGADGELRYLSDGTAVLNLRAASNSREKVDGEWKEVPTWVTISIFGKRAESLGKLGLAKGTKIAARGTLRLREWTSRDGRSGTSLEMRADDVELLGGGSGRRTDEPAPQRHAPEPQAATEEEIPF